MEKLKETDIGKSSEESSKSIENKEDNDQDLNMKKVEKMFNELDIDNELSGLFYNSIKIFFELGKELTENLNKELYDIALKKYQQKKEEIK
ncbi:MAG: hypothetical protein ACOC4M_05560 [Promethearchaeia archaeon]